MASNNFKNLRAKSPAVTKTKNSVSEDVAADKSKKLLSESLIIQTDLKNQLKIIKKDYKKNKSIYDALHNEVVMLRKKREGPKYRKGLNPFDRFKGGGKGGGLLSMLMSAFGISGMLLKPFRSMFVKGIGLIMKGVRSALNSLLRGMGKAGTKAIQSIGRGALSGAKALGTGAKDLVIGGANKIKNSNIVRGAGQLARSGFQKAVSTGARMMGPQGLGRAAVRQVAGLIGRGIIAGTGAAAGFPLLIAAAAASVGYGTYKLGRYLKLSEKLDEFIKKVSSGKYTNLVDFILGLANGTVGKELYGWVKDKISTMFTDSLKFLKEKTNEILGKFSPFANESDDREAEDGDKSIVGGGQAEQLAANKSSGDKAVADNTSTSSDSSSGTDSGGSLWDKLKSSAGSAVQSVKDFALGKSDSSDSDSSGYAADPKVQYSSNLAWHAITGGKNTVINSGYKSKHRPNHEGIDIDAKEGTPLYAIEDGYFKSNWDKGGGNQAFVKDTASGYTYGYAHLSKFLKKNGTKVKAGDVIGLSGNTGRSTGPHIHFSLRKNGVRINPINVKTVVSANNKKEKNTGDMTWPGEVTKVSSNKDSKAESAISGNNLFPKAFSNKSAISPVSGLNFAPDDTSDYSIKAPEIDISSIPKPDILNRITNIVSGKDKDYVGLAKSFADIILKNSNQHDVLSESMQTPDFNPQAQQQPRMQPTPILEGPPQAQSKAGAISGKEGEVKDPRGALNSQIVLACYSPLFI